METRMSIREIMVRDVVKADVNATAKDAALEMVKYDVDSVVVLEDERPVGIVTEKDIVRKVVSKDVKPSSVTLRDLMTSPLISASPDESVSEVARRMAKKQIRRMPVIENGELIGFVADVDIIAFCSEMNDILVDLVEMNVERTILQEKKMAQGICERCGDFSESVEFVNGMMVCESCKEDMMGEG
ncbi:MAG: CBS domain-containing protein [Candidatus Syntropharchaeia archaeon]